ncbi:translocation/assembly module TamB domain-containing protein [bacterium]|nr:translocation/assembly module TamB domain-containing protein [bacterium]
MSTVLRISGRVDNPKLVGDFRCKNIGDEFIELTEMEGRYSLDGKKLVVEGLKGSKEDFQLDGKAEIDLKGKNLNYLFSLKNFPFSLFSSFYPKLKSTGKADIELSGKGNISNQVCAFALKSNQLLVNGERLDNIDIIGEWRSDDFDIKSIRFFKGGKQIIGEATLPVGKSLILKKDKPISLKISWEKQNIGFLGKFIPIFEEFTGESSGQIVVKGTISAPDASGYVNFENGYVKPIGFEDYLKNINVKLVLQENKATFERASFQLGEGSVDMNGNIYLGEGFRFETLARLNNAGIKERNLSSYGEKFQGALNGFVNINGNLRNLIVIGNLTLSNARLDLSSYTISPKVSKVKRTPVVNPAFLLNVNLGKNCWFTSSGSNVLTQGRLTLIGSLVNPAMQGHFSSRSGLVRIANYIFRLQEASVDVAYIGKTLSLNVFARAETSLRGYKITAYINGPYDNLQIRFASSPPLPQNTILAMFIPQEFASDPEKFFKSELANAFAIGVGTTILAPLEFSLAEVTGLEEISFEYGVEGYPVLRLKEGILPKTYLVYSRWLSGPKNRYTVGLEWNIGGDLYLTYSVDELKRKIWGIEGSLRF